MSSCKGCHKSKAPLTCTHCEGALCKACAQFTDELTFQFAEAPPAPGTYCPPCFDEHVGPRMAEYEDVLARAKDVNVFFRTQGKESRFIRRVEKPITVEECDDKDETVLRLAFKAASAGFNALVDVDLSSRKVIHGKWQTSKWKGTAVPAHVDPEQLKRRFAGSPN